VGLCWRAVFQPSPWDQEKGPTPVGFELTFWQWMGAAVSALLVGLSKAGFGAGAGLLAVPLMVSVLGPADMLPVMLLVLITGDVFSLLHYPRDHDRRNLAMLVPGLLLGVALGYLALDWFLALPQSEQWMKRLIGGFCIVFVLVQLFRFGWAARSGVRWEPYRPRLWHGLGLGAGAGLSSTLAHAGGPLLTIFLLPQELDKRTFVGTTVRYFFIGNVAKLVPYTLEGLMTRPNLLLSALLLPAVVAGTFSGVYLHDKFSDRAFRLVVYGLAFLLGIYFVTA